MHEWVTIRPRAGLWEAGRAAAIAHVTVHCTEGATAEGAARWWQNAAARGSAHVVVDDAVAVRAVNDADTAYHARGVNAYSLGLEIAGFAAWTRDEWLEHRPRLLEAGRVHAGWCKAYGIPLVWSTTRGFHSHDGLPGNDHTDPGRGFPWDVYLEGVRGFLAPAAPERPAGRSLRLFLPNGKRYGGWTKGEVPKGYDGPALGPLRWLARKAPGRVKAGTILTWKGGTFTTTAELPAVARTILNRTNGGDR